MGDSSILMPNPDGEFDDRRPGTLQLNLQISCQTESALADRVDIRRLSLFASKRFPRIAFLCLQDSENLHSWVATSMILSSTDGYGFQLSTGNVRDRNGRKRRNGYLAVEVSTAASSLDASRIPSQEGKCAPI